MAFSASETEPITSPENSSDVSLMLMGMKASYRQDRRYRAGAGMVGSCNQTHDMSRPSTTTTFRMGFLYERIVQILS